MARSNLLPLLLVGGLAVAAFIFWNPTICGTLNGFQKSFDFCNFISTDQAIAQDPSSRRIVPRGHTRLHPHHVSHAPTGQNLAHLKAAVKKGGLDFTSDPLTKSNLAEMVDYRMSI